MNTVTTKGQITSIPIAFNSVLKLPVAGGRISAYARKTGGFGNVGAVGYYWTRSDVLI
jgi:hypothetical protein